MARPASAAQARTGDVGATGVVVVVVATLVLSALALYGTWVFWPPEAPPGREAPAQRAVHVFGFTPVVERGDLFVVALACAGLLGGLPRVIRVLAVSSGNRELRWRLAAAQLVVLGLGLAAGAALGFLARWNRPESPYWPAAVAATAGWLVQPAVRAVRPSWK